MALRMVSARVTDRTDSDPLLTLADNSADAFSGVFTALRSSLSDDYRSWSLPYKRDRRGGVARSPSGPLPHEDYEVGLVSMGVARSDRMRDLPYAVHGIPSEALRLNRIRRRHDRGSQSGPRERQRRSHSFVSIPAY